MLNLLEVLQKDKFNPIFYVAAATDNMSLQKAQLLENSLADQRVCYPAIPDGQSLVPLDFGAIFVKLTKEWNKDR
ncbi:uncharacterized protein LOC130969632 isoform X2 [Arachis stenosperma]|uniref:uncharacterized protein LOC130969632 isoform X2 n=1 Tax=Arachis stenosperma TaxID=217475 RepID=UPI0025AD85AC|nr:uncharacterized protein LOC130969632 isoform X2 [Arachis stenosperma]XP_057751441.1 uncharacterized protein LOC130969632 isoform X2 [Arachis stenosperma]